MTDPAPGPTGSDSPALYLRASAWLTRASDWLFGWESSGQLRGLWILWAGGWYILGAFVWSYLLDGGRIPFDLHDWAMGTGHRLAFLKNAVVAGMLPLHMPDGSALRNVTDRFIATPDTILSPQILLLRYLDLGPFVVANTLLLYTAGFVGILLLARRLQLSPFVFAVLFCLFGFNGHITDHIVVGHMHWAGYYLLPYFILLVLDLADKGPAIRWRWVLGVSVVLFGMFLQGAFHLFVMSLVFLGLLGAARLSLLRSAVAAAAASILLSLGRILPPALEASRFDSEFLSGFVTLEQLVQALIQIRSPTPEQAMNLGPLTRLGWWEVDHYIGLAGLAFLLVYGIAAPSGAAGALRRAYDVLILPILAMALLSIGRVYKLVNLTGIPLLSSQRVSTRFFVFSLLFLVVLGAMSLQESLDRVKHRRLAKAALLVGLLVLLHDLWQHVKLWRVENLGGLFRSFPVDFSGEFVANHPDPAYTTALGVGWSAALLTLLTLVLLARREGKERGVGGQRAA